MFWNEKQLEVIAVDNGYIVKWSDASMEGQLAPDGRRQPTGGHRIFSDKKDVLAYVNGFFP